MKPFKITLYTLLFSPLTNSNYSVKLKNNIVIYIDRNNPNKIIKINYKELKFLDSKVIDGLSNHKIERIGSKELPKYFMVIPKDSYFVKIYSPTNLNFIKKIELPFRPYSLSGHNEKYNLMILTARDRPASVIIDINKLKIVAIAGFDRENPYSRRGVLNPYEVYRGFNSFERSFSSSFAIGGDSASGDPIWISSEAFALIDKAKRSIRIYKLINRRDGEFKTELIQIVKTDSSVSRLIPESDEVDNRVFYAVAEGSGVRSLTAGLYKFIVVNHRLREVNFIKLKYKSNLGTNGHALYITPDKKYLYLPVGANFKVKDRGDWYSQMNREKTLENNYNSYVKLFLRDYIKESEISNYSKVSELFRRFSKIDSYTPKAIPSKNQYILNNYYKQEFEFIQRGGVYILDAKSMEVVGFIEAGKGASEIVFSKKRGFAIVSNNLDDYITIIDYKRAKLIKNIDLPFKHERIFNISQSHKPYISVDGDYYYNFWSDGGEFFRVDLKRLEVDKSIHIGGIPLRGDFYEKIADIDKRGVEFFNNSKTLLERIKEIFLT